MERKDRDGFHVHKLAAIRRRTRAGKRPTSSPVTVVRVNPEALKLAHELAADRDVYIDIQLDGTIYIRNGTRS